MLWMGVSIISKWEQQGRQVTVEAGWIPAAKWLIDRLLELEFQPSFQPNFCLIFFFTPDSQSHFFWLGDALRDRPATQEMGTCVPNGRRHGGSANNAKSD